MAYWEAAQRAEFGKEFRGLQKRTDRAVGREEDKSLYSGVGGFLGSAAGIAGGAAIATALAPMTGGVSLGWLGTAVGAGIGSAAGRTAGSALAGKSLDIDKGGTFLRPERQDISVQLGEAKKGRQKNILKASLMDAATAGFFKSGGSETLKKYGAQSMSKMFGEETAASMFKTAGLVDELGDFGALTEGGTAGKDFWESFKGGGFLKTAEGDPLKLKDAGAYIKGKRAAGEAVDWKTFAQKGFGESPDYINYLEDVAETAGMSPEEKASTKGRLQPKPDRYTTGLTKEEGGRQSKLYLGKQVGRDPYLGEREGFDEPFIGERAGLDIFSDYENMMSQFQEGGRFHRSKRDKKEWLYPYNYDEITEEAQPDKYWSYTD